jgi:glycosyltransferase involved in cell wall biosynthesis
MKIGLFSYAFPYPEAGYNPGIETVVYNLAKNIGKNEEVTVYTSFINGGEEEDHLDGFRVLRASKNKIGLFSLNNLLHGYKVIKKYRREIKNEDILHDIGSLASYWFKSFECPSVATFHHYEASTDLRSVLQNLPYFFLPKKESIVDRVIAVSDFSKKQLIDLYSIDEKKISVIPNGIDLNTFYPIKKDSCKNLLLYAGPLTRRKGLTTLLHAMPRVIKEIENPKLIITGEGPEKNRLIKEVKNLGIANHVEFVGFLPRKELVEYYQDATVFIFPTVLEGFGLVALESIASGTPVIASRIQPLISILDNAGIFFKAGDHNQLAQATIEILKDSKLRDDLRKKGLERVKKFSWDKIAEKHLELYQNLIDGNE